MNSFQPDPRYGGGVSGGKVEIKVCNMQSQQTGTEPEYKDLVQFLPWGSLSASEQGGAF